MSNGTATITLEQLRAGEWTRSEFVSSDNGVYEMIRCEHCGVQAINTHPMHTPDCWWVALIREAKRVVSPDKEADNCGTRTTDSLNDIASNYSLWSYSAPKDSPTNS